MKCKQLLLGFEPWLPCPFLMTISITSQVPPVGSSNISSKVSVIFLWPRVWFFLSRYWQLSHDHLFIVLTNFLWYTCNYILTLYSIHSVWVFLFYCPYLENNQYQLILTCKFILVSSTEPKYMTYQPLADSEIEPMIDWFIGFKECRLFQVYSMLGSVTFSFFLQL